MGLRGCQTKLGNELADSIREFPSLLLDNTAKTKTLALDLVDRELTPQTRASINIKSGLSPLSLNL